MHRAEKWDPVFRDNDATTNSRAEANPVNVLKHLFTLLI
jgi:hypothetical protein